MPRFSDIEKKQIEAKLLLEGERLFTVYGLKKATIDEIVAAVNIAKATFYTFYDCKEALYLDIVQNIQLKIFTQLSTLLKTNTNLNNKQRVKQVLTAMYAQMLKYPILAQIDTCTVELISRRVDINRLTAFSQQNIDAAFILVEHGIKLTCSPQAASCTLQAIYHGWLSLQSKEKHLQEEATNIILESVINRIICD